jgi:acetyltransferase-like isoleucine patch superfamily enzyme
MNGMDLVSAEIRNCIEKQLDRGMHDFIIFPYGDVGMKVKNYLNNTYGITERYIVDNHLCKYNSKIISVQELAGADCEDAVVILASMNKRIYAELMSSIKPYFRDEDIVELNSMTEFGGNKECYKTKIGKYSYGPIAETSVMVESVGAFCSFAEGSRVVGNHATQYITTHPMMYVGAEENNQVCWHSYERFCNNDWYFPGIKPKGKLKKAHKVKIGNDVWFGKDVTVTNYSNIGNGVIAGAGAVITKDVPDYAIVMGVPARIVGYRYKPEQIEALNRIEWWNWSDDEIRERYDDFYLPIEKFIEKWDKLKMGGECQKKVCDLVQKNRKIILWGAGISGIRTLYRLQKAHKIVEFFVDSGIEGEVHGIPIRKDLSGIKNIKDYYIIVSTGEIVYPEIREKLLQMNLLEFDDFIWGDLYGKSMVVINANCHGVSLKKLLLQSKQFQLKYGIYPVPPVHDNDKGYIEDTILEHADVCIYQDIRENNKFSEKLSYPYILKRLGANCKKICIPNLVGNGFGFFPTQVDEVYRHKVQGGKISLYYRDRLIDEAVEVIGAGSLDDIMQYIENYKFDKNEIKMSFSKMMERIRDREKMWDI